MGSKYKFFYLKTTQNTTKYIPQLPLSQNISFSLIILLTERNSVAWHSVVALKSESDGLGVVS